MRRSTRSSKRRPRRHRRPSGSQQRQTVAALSEMASASSTITRSSAATTPIFGRRRCARLAAAPYALGRLRLGPRPWLEILWFGPPWCMQSPFARGRTASARRADSLLSRAPRAHTARAIAATETARATTPTSCSRTTRRSYSVAYAARLASRTRGTCSRSGPSRY